MNLTILGLNLTDNSLVDYGNTSVSLNNYTNNLYHLQSETAELNFDEDMLEKNANILSEQLSCLDIPNE